MVINSLSPVSIVSGVIVVSNDVVVSGDVDVSDVVVRFRLLSRAHYAEEVVGHDDPLVFLPVVGLGGVGVGYAALVHRINAFQRGLCNTCSIDLIQKFKYTVAFADHATTDRRFESPGLGRRAKILAAVARRKKYNPLKSAKTKSDNTHAALE